MDLFDKKHVRATFWAIFFTNSSGHPACVASADLIERLKFLSFRSQQAQEIQRQQRLMYQQTVVSLFSSRLQILILLEISSFLSITTRDRCYDF
jgi:hypothetical protein